MTTDAPTPRDWREGMYSVDHGDGRTCWHRDRRKVERRARREPLDVEVLARAVLNARSTTGSWKGNARATEPTPWDRTMARRIVASLAEYARLEAER